MLYSSQPVSLMGRSVISTFEVRCWAACPVPSASNRCRAGPSKETFPGAVLFTSPPTNGQQYEDMGFFGLRKAEDNDLSHVSAANSPPSDKSVVKSLRTRFVCHHFANFLCRAPFLTIGYSTPIGYITLAVWEKGKGTRS